MIKFRVKIKNNTHKINCIISASDWAAAIEQAIQTTQLASPLRVFVVAL